MRAVFVILYIILGPFLGGLLEGLDRKIGARMQGRQGPPLLQPFYDIAKLFSKRTLVVNRVQDFLIYGYLVFNIFTGCLFFAGEDFLLTLFALTLAGIFSVMAACSASSPFSSMGSQRELIQMMAYEPMVLLTAIGFYQATGSFMVKDIVSSSVAPIVAMPGFFVGFLFILLIKFHKSPFDISTSHHAHQEMVKGTTTELSGSILARSELAEWYENVFLVGVVGLFIVDSSWWSIPLAVLGGAAAYFIATLADNVFPRVKWDTMLKATWAVTFFAGVGNLIVLTLMR